MIEVAIDSSQGSSMALLKDDTRAYLSNLDFGRDSDAEFLPCLKHFLAENGLELGDIQGWTVGLGPGSFAGIRFALALVKGICTATGAKARGIPSSLAMALACHCTGRIAVIQDARCGKIFVSKYICDGAGCRPEGLPEMLDLAKENSAWADCDCYCTNAAGLKEGLPDVVQQKLEEVSAPEAQYLLDQDSQVWPWLDTPDVEPIYVRPPA